MRPHGRRGDHDPCDLFILLVLFPLVGRKGRGRCVRRVCRVLMRVLGVRMTVRGAVPSRREPNAA